MYQNPISPIAVLETESGLEHSLHPKSSADTIKGENWGPEGRKRGLQRKLGSCNVSQNFHTQHSERNRGSEIFANLTSEKLKDGKLYMRKHQCLFRSRKQAQYPD